MGRGIGRALRPTVKPPKLAPFLTYDMEWFPGTQKLRVICVYDGSRARHYFTIEAFLRNELTRENAGKRFYAHAGGMYDVAYILEHIVLETGWVVSAGFSASSAVVVSVHKDGHKFQFCDSFFLLRSSLEKIAKWTGDRKGTDKEGDKDPEQTRLEKFHAPLPELIEYCKQDCVILWRALKATQYGLYELGCEMKVTAASTAMGFFRYKFLGEIIPTSDAVNRIARDAYCASRVEIVRPVAHNVYCLDFNSSFPYSMTFPQPGKLIKTQWRYLPKEGTIYLAEVTVKVPPCHIPAVPYRLDGRVYFPIGQWGPVWMSSVDIELLQEAGGTVVDVGRILIFEAQSWLSEYVHLLYDLRKNETDEFRRELLKILLNSLYGKFAENEEKTSLLIHPKHTTCRHSPPCERYDPETNTYEENSCLEMLFPGAYLETKRKAVQHVHVPISMHITALSRRLLYRGTQVCPDVAMMDTDSLHTSMYKPEDCDNLTGRDLGNGIRIGNELGELKFDPPKRYSKMTFLAPKVYSGEYEEGGKRKIRAKGFPGLDDELFTLLEAGYSVGFRSTMRIKGLFRSTKEGGDPNLTPRDNVVFKGLVGGIRPKRCMTPDGSSRPWDVAELAEEWHGKRKAG